MKRWLTTGCASLCRGMTTVSMAVLLMLALPITYDATARAFGHPTIWVFEVSVYALIAAGFLANPVALRTGAHFRVTILHKLFPRLRRALDVFALLMTLLFSMLLIGTGFYFVWYAWHNHILSATMLEVPLWIPQLALPIGGVGLFLQTLALLLSGQSPGEEEDVAAESIGD